MGGCWGIKNGIWTRRICDVLEKNEHADSDGGPKMPQMVLMPMIKAASSSGAAAAGLAPLGAKLEAASPGRERAQKRVVWSFEAETRRCQSGWNAVAQTFESCGWESVARGGIWGAGAESAAVLGDV